MKKFITILFISLLTLSLVACGGSGDETESKETDATEAQVEETQNEASQAEESAESEASIDVIKVQIGFENAMYEPIGKALERWQELVAEKGNGSMEIVLYPDSQLGSKNELIDSMLLGEPVITLADGAFYADYGVNDFGILFGPFLFDNWDQCWTLIESDWYKEQSNLLEEKGLKLVVSNWVYGERHTMTNDPVEAVEDLNGMKIRVPSNQIQTEGFNILGATAVGMPLGDAYEALSTGTIEGVENPIATLYGRKFQEVSKHLILDGHVKNFTTWVTGTMFFDSLSPEQQELLVSTGEEAGIYNNKLVEEAEQGFLDDMVAEGVNVVEPSEEVLAGFKEKAQPFYDMEDTFGWSAGLYDTVREAMGAK